MGKRSVEQSQQRLGSLVTEVPQPSSRNKGQCQLATVSLRISGSGNREKLVYAIPITRFVKG
jgi:hypothetical protein